MAADLDVVVAPNGEVVRCTPSSASGDEMLSAQACELVSSSRWEPARDEAKQPVHARVRIPLKLVDIDSPGGWAAEDWSTPADVEVPVAKLPRRKEDRQILVHVMVGGDGKVAACDEDGYDRPMKAYVEQACRTLIGTNRGVLTDETGAATPYFANSVVAFVFETSEAEAKVLPNTGPHLTCKVAPLHQTGCRWTR